MQPGVRPPGKSQVRRYGLVTGVVCVASGAGLEGVLQQDPVLATLPAVLLFLATAFRALPSPAKTPALVLGVDLEVRPSPGRGLGLFALKAVPKGTFVTDYIGEELTESDFVKRYDGSGVADYGAELEGVLPWFQAPSYIDALDPKKSNAARFMNHSRTGNLKKVKQRFPKRKLRLYANRDIQPNDELTWDYGRDYWIGRENIIR